MDPQVLGSAPRKERARVEATAAGSWAWTSAAVVHLASEGSVVVGRKVGMLGAAAAALVAVLRSFDLAEVVG